MTRRIGIGVCLGMVAVNVMLLFVAPLPELRAQAVMSLGISTFGALAFWARK